MYKKNIFSDDNKLIKFYTNLYPANKNKKYIYYNIVNIWDDYNLEVTHDFIQWLFPDETGGVNSNAPKLTKKDIIKFVTNNNLRKNVIYATLRMLSFYGFTIKGSEIKQIKPLKRKYKGYTIGLYSTHNYRRITRILNFLVKIKMGYLSSLFFLAICNAIKSDPSLLNKVIKNNSLKIWMSTQPFLKNYLYTYNNQEKISQLQKECRNKVYGLNYISNSCYMDSTLMSLLTIPNKVITDNILNKNLEKLKKEHNLWIKCSDNIDVDIKNRRNIQSALNTITKSIRGLNNVQECTLLRNFIKYCPGPQQFHKGETQDAGEFLTYLFNLFQVDIAKTSRKTYGSNDVNGKPKWKLIRKQIDNKSSPIIQIESTKLLEIPEEYDITKFIKQTLYSTLDEKNIWYPDKVNYPEFSFNRKKETVKIKDSPYIIFNLLRTYGKIKFSKDGEFLGIDSKNIWKRIQVPEKMELKDKKLHLSAIVVHTGGAHYVANFKCEDQWFWYDDSPGSSSHVIKYIGSYNKMIKTYPNPLTHGTLFFYK